MTASGFLSQAEVERFLAFYQLDLQEIALELRSLVYQVCPFATERILWGGLSYHDSARGGPVKGAICQIELKDNRVLISFIHGVRLADSNKLLSGDRLSKRYLEVDSYKDAPWDAIRDLIQEAAEITF